MKYLKIAVFSFNLLIWVGGFVVLVIGAWLLLEPSNGHLLNLFAENSTQDAVDIVGYTLLGLSFIIFVVGLFGCRASMRGNQCILGVYTSMLITLIASELAVLTVAGFMTYRTLSGLESQLRGRLTEYGHDETSDLPFSYSLDFVQYKFNCCGILGDDDYNETAWWRDGQYSGTRRQVPLTCCVLKNPEVKNAGSPMSVVTRVFHKDSEKPWLHPQPRDEAACQITDPEGQEGFRHKEGCFEKMTDWLREESLSLVLMTLAIVSFQTLGVISAALLCRNIRNEEAN